MESIKMGKILKRQKGATMIEYALLAALISVAAVVILSTVGTEIVSTFSDVAAKL
jgi:pilus assembly protein Flp/PilA